MDIVNLLFRANTSDLDKAEKKLDNVGSKAEGVSAKAKKLGDSFKELKDVGGPIGDVVSHVDDLSTRVGTAVSGALRLGPALAIAAGAAGVLAAVRFAGTLDDIGDLAEKLGLSATQAALLDQQMKAGGTSVDTYYNGLQRVSNALSKADEEGKKAADALKTLGVNVKDSTTPQETLTALTEKYGDQLRNGKVSADEMAALQLVLGKNFRETIVATEQAAIAQERHNSFAAASVGISQDGVKAAGDFERAQNDIAFVLQAVGSQLVAKVVPAFTALINQLVESYKNGGLVKVAFDGIGLAANLVMVPIRVLINLFITLDTVITSVGKSIGAVFAALATRSLEPLKALREDVSKLFEEADAKVKAVGLWGTDSGTVAPAQAPQITPAVKGAGKDADGPYREYLRMKDEEAKRQMDDLKRYEAAELAAQKEYESLMKRIQGYKDLADPSAQYRRELEQLIKDYETGLVPAEAFAAKQLELETNIDRATGKLKEQGDQLSITQRIGETAFKGLEDALMQFVTTGKLNFKGFVASVLQDLARLIIQIKIIQPLMKAMSASGGFSWAGLVSAFAASANGNVFGGSGLLKSANGNVFDGPVLHGFNGGIGVLGEAGPEAVMPLKRGANGQLGVQVQGGTAASSQHIQINVTVEGGKDAEATGNAVAMKVQELFVRGIVKQELQADRRGRAYAV